MKQKCSITQKLINDSYNQIYFFKIPPILFIPIITLLLLPVNSLSTNPIFVTTLPSIETGQWVLSTISPTVSGIYSSQNTNVSFINAYPSIPSIGYGINFINSNYQTTLALTETMIDVSVVQKQQTYALVQLNRTTNSITQLALSYIVCDSSFFFDIRQTLVNLQATILYTSSIAKSLVVDLPYKTKSNSSNAQILYNTVGVDMFRQSRTFEFSANLYAKSISSFSIEIKLGANNRLKWIKFNTISYQTIANSIDPPYYIDFGITQSYAGLIPDSSGLSITTYGTVFLGLIDFTIDDANSIFNLNLTLTGLNYLLSTTSLTQTKFTYFWYRKQTCPDYTFLSNNICEPCHHSCLMCTSSTNTSCLSCPSTRSYFSSNRSCPCITNYVDVNVSLCVQLTCQPSCLTCANLNQCGTCDSNLGRVLNGTNCNCKNYTVDVYQTMGTTFCYPCHFTCLSCSTHLSQTSCLTCNLQKDHRFYRASNNTCACIDKYYATTSTSNPVCASCHYSCNACNNGISCMQCNSTKGRTLNATSSLCSCMSNFYDDFLNQQCISCPNKCLTCNSQGCLTCESSFNRYLSNKQCLCNNGFYDDGVNAQCKQCDYTCATCTSSLECSSCNGTLKRYMELSSGKKLCLCASGTYEVIGIQQCMVCSSKCMTCTGPNANNCKTCDINKYRQLSLTNECLCSSGYFQTTSLVTFQPICEKCHYTCQTCTDSLSCSTCNVLKYRFRSSGGSFCDCKTGYYDNGNQLCLKCDYKCLTCTQSGLCQTCDTNTRNSSDLSNCVCLPGYWDDGINNICQSCLPQCRTCTDGNGCTSCPTNKMLTLTKTCVCVPHTYSPNCLPCHYSCQQCTNTATQCTRCNSSSNRYLNTTLNQCLCYAGYFDDGSNELCVSCHYSCLSCSSYDKCDSCPPNRVMNGSFCSCVNQFYQNSTNKNCLPCHYSCQTCQSFSQCTSCNILMKRTFPISGLTNFTLCKCLNGYYDNGLTQICFECDPRCLTCLSYRICLTCDSALHRYFIPSSSDCKCLDGYYEDSSTFLCVKCHYSCQTCLDSVSCLTCKVGRHLQLGPNALCLCNSGTFDSPTTQLCQLCSYPCLQCSLEANKCTSCEKNRNLIVSNSSCVCKVGTFDNGTMCESCPPTCSECTNKTACTVCKIGANRNLDANNLCPCIYGFHDENSLQIICKKCHYSCLACSNSLSCLTCVSGRTPIIDSICQCPVQRFYDDGVNGPCIPCSYSCLSCTGLPNICTSCSPQSKRLLINESCICSEGYFDDNVEICVRCHYSCKSCSSSLTCSSCESAFQRVYQSGPYCSCRIGFYDDGLNSQCQKCDYKCASCSDIATHCLSCPLTRTIDAVNNVCPCDQGLYDSGVSTCSNCLYDCLKCQNQLQCTECPLTRTLQPNSKRCLCNDGLYDASQKQCLPCHPLCLTCIDYDQCLTCDTVGNFRYLLNSKCICPKGYLDNFTHDGTQQCLKCPHSCESCVSQTQCSSCLITAQRVYNISTKLCSCMTGYFDDSINMPCLKCSFDCLTCADSSTCLTCLPERVLNPLSNRCECAQSYYVNGTQCELCPPQCSSCTNLTFCTACNGQRVLSNNNCNCPLGQYKTISFPYCEPCQYSCQSCISPFACSTCNTLNKRFLSGSYCKCMMGFFDDNSSQICQPCHYSCKTCVKGTQCLSCDLIQNRVLNLNTHLCECLNNYFQDPVTKVCIKCHYTCVTCTNGSQCSTCNGLYFRSLNPANNQCQCPLIGYFDDGQQAMCQTCHFTCLSCKNSAQNCTSCADITNRLFNSNKCLCKDGYYDNGGLVCQKCSYKCLKCDVLADNCTDCLVSAVRTLTQNNCDCEVGFYDNGFDTLCQPCDYRCLSCLNPFTCLSCNSSENRILNSLNTMCDCLSVFYDNGIDADCVPCHYSCLTCNHPTLCLSCPDTRVFINGVCQCKLKYFDDFSSLQCQPCHYSCESCTNSTQCTACSPLKHRIYNASTTKCSCMEGFYDTLNQSQLCLKCHSSCLTCLDSNSCQRCPSNINKTINLTQSSYCTCLYGHYENVTAGIVLGFSSVCMPCHYSCEECSIGAYFCTSCQGLKNRYLTPQKSCLCLSRYYDDGINQLCLLCTQNCLKCFGQQINNCLQCDNSSYILNNQCYGSCPDYYYNYLTPFTYIKTCKLCTPYCLKCPVKQTICTACQASHYLLHKDASNQICVDKCPYLYFSTASKQCLQCSFPCKQCLSQFQCIDCVNGYYFSNGYCYKCYSQCGQCKGSTVFDCLSCSNGYYLNNGLCKKLSCLKNQYVNSQYGCMNCSQTFPHSLTCDSVQIFSCQKNYILQKLRLENGSLLYQCKACSQIKGFSLFLVDKEQQCREICGDGIAINSQCDDGNSLNGDGCSQFCAIQNDWQCINKSSCSLKQKPEVFITKINKIPNQNQIEIFLSLSIGLRLQKGNFILTFTQNNTRFSYQSSATDSKFTSYKLKITYQQTIQKKKLSLKILSPIVQSSKQSTPKQSNSTISSNQLRNLQTEILQVPLEIDLFLQLEVQIFTNPPATFINQQTRSFFTSWLLYIFGGYQCVCILIGLWMLYKKIRLMLIFIDLMTSLRVVYILCTFGMHQISDLVPYSLKGLQPFIYPFGPSIKNQESAFYMMDYTQLIFSSCFIQIALILICLGIKYFSSKEKNTNSSLSENNGGYYLNTVVFTCGADIYLSCFCVFIESSFDTYSQIYSWVIGLTLVIFFLFKNLLYVINGNDQQNNLRSTIPTRSFATSQIDIKDKTFNHNIFLDQQQFNSENPQNLDKKKANSHDEGNSVTLKSSNTKKQTALKIEENWVKSLFTNNLQKRHNMYDLKPISKCHQNSPFDTSSTFYQTLSANPISRYHLPVLNNIFPLMLVMVSTLICSPSLIFLRSILLLVVVGLSFLLMLIDNKQPIKSSVRSIKLILNFVSYLAICIILIISSKSQAQSNFEWIDFSILSIACFLLTSNLLFWVLNLKYSSQYKEYLIEMKNQEIIKKNQLAQEPKKKFFTSILQTKKPSKYHIPQQLKSHSVSEINSVPEQISSYIKHHSNSEYSSYHEHNLNPYDSSLRPGQNFWEDQSINYNRKEGITTEKINIQAKNDLNVFLDIPLKQQNESIKSRKKNKGSFQKEKEYFEKKHQFSAIDKSKGKQTKRPQKDSKNSLVLVSQSPNKITQNLNIFQVGQQRQLQRQINSVGILNKPKKRIEGNIQEKLIKIENYAQQKEQPEKLSQIHYIYKNPTKSVSSKSKSKSKQRGINIKSANSLKIIEKSFSNLQTPQKSPSLNQKITYHNNSVQEKDKSFEDKNNCLPENKLKTQQIQTKKQTYEFVDFGSKDSKLQDERETKLSQFTSKQKAQTNNHSLQQNNRQLKYDFKREKNNKTQLRSNHPNIFNNEDQLSDEDYELQFPPASNNKKYHQFVNRSSEKQNFGKKLNNDEKNILATKNKKLKRNTKSKNSSYETNFELSISKATQNLKPKFQDISSIFQQSIINNQVPSAQQDLNVYDKILIEHQKYKKTKIDEKLIENQLKRKESQQTSL